MTTYLSLVRDDRIVATALVDDAVWNAKRAVIERAALMAGYTTRVDNALIGLDGPGPGKTCRTLPDVGAWIASTAGWV